MNIYYLIAMMLVVVSVFGVVMFIVLVFGLDMLYTNWSTKVPWVKTPARNLELIVSDLNLPPQSLIYDLGCGDGRLLFIAEKHGLKAVGFELALYPYVKAIIRKFATRSKVRIYRRNFLNEDLSGAKAVFIFLTTSVMTQAGLHLDKLKNLGIPIISYGFMIPGWKAKNVLPTIPSKTYFY